MAKMRDLSAEFAMAASSAPTFRSSVLANLDPLYLAMIERGVPTVVASCDTNFRPSVTLAAGCVLDVDAGEMTVFVPLRAAARLIDDIALCGRIAVLCVEPVSHRAVQLKSSVVRSRSADASDESALARYLVSVENELLQVGHAREFTRCIVPPRSSDLVALSFVPDVAFNQAPGPQAGASLSS